MKNIKIVFASGNEHKKSEMKLLINKNLNSDDLKIEILSLKDIGFTDEIIENGKTFEENAEIKARAVFDKTDMMCFADDSGLCVDYLNGAPGIYSARYSGGDDEANINKLLDELKSLPNEKRTAHFYCALYCVVSKDESFCVSGKCEGIILSSKNGANGFGYDPVFYYPPMFKTFAQMTSDEKNKFSHRAMAAEQFAKKVVEYIK